MGGSNPRFIRSFMLIELVLMSYLLHPTDIKVEALCDLNTITSCGHYLYIRLFECSSVSDPDLTCRQSFCVGGSIVQTPNDCCLAMTEVPIQWRVQLNALYYRDPTVPGDYCCCDPERASPSAEPNGDDQTDTATPIMQSYSQDQDANNNGTQDQDADNDADQTDSTSSGGFTQVSSNNFNRQMFNAEAWNTPEDSRECRPPIPWLNGDCTDDECERRCGIYSYGDNPIHVCKNNFKCCCNYDAARDLVTPYDYWRKQRHA